MGIGFVVAASTLGTAGLAFPWAFIAAYEGGAAAGGTIVAGVILVHDGSQEINAANQVPCN